ncbi:MAG TPA: hypothetical protein VFM14_04860 [Gemmatimonadales bacterium]|nr:hypothetical protein [Gemmatimonadales bacterium]
MFIELTDHLRCPREHPEAYLVLLPDEVVQRSVRTGQLGCPVCGATYRIEDGVAELGGGPPPAGPALDGRVAHVLLGLNGPGGYVALCGIVAAGWRAFAEAEPGVAIVAVNPPPGVADDAPILSVVRAPIIPLKTRSMRGVVLGGSLGGDAQWVREAARVTLPGLRVVGQGALPELSELELLANADGTWVAARR